MPVSARWIWTFEVLFAIPDPAEARSSHSHDATRSAEAAATRGAPAGRTAETTSGHAYEAPGRHAGVAGSRHALETAHAAAAIGVP